MRETFKTADAELLKWLTGASTGPAGQPHVGASADQLLAQGCELGLRL